MKKNQIGFESHFFNQLESQTLTFFLVLVFVVKTLLQKDSSKKGFIVITTSGHKIFRLNQICNKWYVMLEILENLLSISST